jgi:ABC-type sugar transport system permease subunit
MASSSFSLAERTAQDRRTRQKEAKRNAWAYVFVSPFYLLYAIFGFFPLVYGLWLSLHTWDGISPMVWVGFNNYIKLVTVDELWWKAIYNTIWLFVVATIPQLTLALGLAFIINSGYVRFKDFFRAAYFMPFVASAVAVGILFTSLFGNQYGMIKFTLFYLYCVIMIPTNFAYFLFNFFLFVLSIQPQPKRVMQTKATWSYPYYSSFLPIRSPI